MTTQQVATAAAQRVPPPGGSDTMGRFRWLPAFWKGVVIALTLAVVGLFIVYNFGISFGPWVLEPTPYYLLIYLTLILPVYLLFPMRKADKQKLPWYDVVIGLIGTAVIAFFLVNAGNIAAAAWLPPPDNLILAAAILIFLLSMEAGRRVGGKIFLIICLVFGLYPLFAGWMPGPLYGVQLTFPKLMGQFAFSANGILGLPAQTNGEIVIGYLLFSGVMVGTGAGKFFLDVAMMLLGRFRGGPAKVCVFASALFGSLSSSGVANIVAVGTITIPAMKKMGYPAHYAGAIEACASSGSALTPPVMGTIAFIMAILTNTSYAAITVAAILPAVLYFWGLIIQVDGYAARVGMKGLDRAEIPRWLPTLKNGWIFAVSLIFLVWYLMVMGKTAEAPILASVVLIILPWLIAIGGLIVNKIRKGNPGESLGRAVALESWKRFKALGPMIGSASAVITWMVAILLPVGLIVTGLTVTGTAANLISQIVRLGEASTFLVLIVTAVACYLLGMIGLALIPYIFLAVTMAPAVVKTGGLDLIAVHLFLVYLITLSGITPPVAMMAFVGAAVAGAPPMKTGWTAMRLGVVLFFVPFFFVYNPTLLMKGPPLEIIANFGTALVGVWLLASGLEGYLLKFGTLPWWARILVVIGGFIFAVPFAWYLSLGIGVVFTGISLGILLLVRRARREPLLVKGI